MSSSATPTFQSVERQREEEASQAAVALGVLEGGFGKIAGEFSTAGRLAKSSADAWLSSSITWGPFIKMISSI